MIYLFVATNKHGPAYFACDSARSAAEAQAEWVEKIWPYEFAGDPFPGPGRALARVATELADFVTMEVHKLPVRSTTGASA